MRQEKLTALVRHMRTYPQAQVYEGAAPGGKTGSGHYFVTYGGPKPDLTFSKAEVDELVREGILHFQYPEFYGRGPKFPA